jgi:hypothetical protein
MVNFPKKLSRTCPSLIPSYFPSRLFWRHKIPSIILGFPSRLFWRHKNSLPYCPSRQQFPSPLRIEKTFSTCSLRKPDRKRRIHSCRCHPPIHSSACRRWAGTSCCRCRAGTSYRRRQAGISTRPAAVAWLGHPPGRLPSPGRDDLLSSPGSDLHQVLKLTTQSVHATLSSHFRSLPSI